MSSAMTQEIKQRIEARTAMKNWKQATLSLYLPTAHVDEPVDEARRIFFVAPHVYAVLEPHEQLPPVPETGTGTRRWTKIGERVGLHIYELE